MRILGIESSCDETAAAVVTETGQVLSDVINSQVPIHAPYGGVIPEVASRNHLRAIVPVVRAALDQAQIQLDDVDGIAVTCRPGLMGALLVGVQFAKGLAFGARRPIVGVDHLAGHLLAGFVRVQGASDIPQFPYVALLASGGHTSVYRVDGPLDEHMQELGGTRDDAAGEAFDKVSKLLGLGYPGGPIIDQLATRGDPKAIAVPRPMRSRSSLEMSFSGIKTFIAGWVAAHGVPENDQLRADICASFQAAVVDTLVRKTILAARHEQISRVVLGGGVGANSALRAALQSACDEREIEVVLPARASCTDNGAMIAYAGAMRFAHGVQSDLSLAVSTSTGLGRATRRGGGPRR